jgi:DNA helicase-2/ATP-dependent DNA helicase PcrA
MMKSNYDKKFSEELLKLNTEQLQSIENKGRPMMVIAGPGTGKTQVLSMRIANILQGEANANEILCLTYTDAGALAMRKRLTALIGEEAAKVTICTFHAFCNMVIQENNNFFQMQELEPVSDLEHFKIIQQIIDDLPLDSKLLKLKTNTYQWIKPLKLFYETAKSEHWTAEYLEIKCKEYLELIAEEDEYKYKRGAKTGQLKPDYFVEKERILRTLEAIGTMQKHDEIMKQNQRYTFQDMLLWTFNLFQKNEDVLMSYQERFQYILVDEYQDTSGIQNDLLFQLCNYEKPNVFVVGDDDQSIYRFQNANVENILNYKLRFQNEDLQEIVLLQNYRSTQPILDAALSLIEKNENRVVKAEFKKIKSSKNFDEKDITKPQILEFENEIHESAYIAHQISDLINNRQVKPSEIAVLYKNHKYAENIIRSLQALKIDVSVRKRENLLNIPLIHQIFTVMRYVSNELKKPFSAENELFELLHYPFFKNSALDIASFSASMFEQSNKDKKWRKHLSLLQPKQDLFTINENDVNHLFESNAKLEKLIKKAVELPFQLWFDYLLQEMNIISIVFKSDEDIFLLNAITTLFDHIKQVTAANSKLTLQQYLVEIDMMETYGIELNINRVIGNNNGVQFTTMHSSKGLEYEYVFMIHNENTSWETRNNGTNIKIPSNLYGAMHKPEEEKAANDEKRRLFYVAMTRAKQHLSISYSAQDLSGKGMQPVVFIEELKNSNKVDFTEIKLSNTAIIEFIKSTFQTSDVPKIPMIQRPFIQQKVEKFKLSTTALNNYLSCPLSFYFNNIIRVPAAKSPVMIFGTIIHNVLQDCYVYLNEIGILPDLNFIQLKIDKQFLRHAEIFTNQEITHQKHYAFTILKNYRETIMPTWKKGSQLERPVEAVFEGFQLKGKLDRIDFIGKNAEIVDYKTGKFKSEKFKIAESDNAENKGGDYWRQAIFYKILLDNEPLKKWETSSASFEFVEPEEKNNEKIIQIKKVQFSTEEINLAKAQIRETMHSIRNFEFDKGCGKKECQWCNFVKQNYESIIIQKSDEQIENYENEKAPFGEI